MELTKISKHGKINFFVDSESSSIEPINDYVTTQESNCLILYTSGTHGEAKAIKLSPRFLLERLTQLSRIIPLEEIKNTLSVLPLYFGHGLIANSLLPLFCSQNLFIGNPPTTASKKTVAEIIDQYEISFFSSVPSLWHTIDTIQKPKNRSLKRIHCASAPLSSSLYIKMNEFAPQARIFNVYGMTEMGSWISGYEIKSPENVNKIGSGWGFNLKLDDVDQNGVGQIKIGIQNDCTEYLDSNELNQEKFRNGYFYSGDQGSQDSDGNICFLGRKDDVINKGGAKVFPDEVENTLQMHPMIERACVFGLPHQLFNEVVCAAYIKKTNKNVTSSELENWCRLHLPSYRVPSRWFELTELKFTPTGKIKRKSVADYCKKIELESENDT